MSGIPQRVVPSTAFRQPPPMPQAEPEEQKFSVTAQGEQNSWTQLAEAHASLKVQAAPAACPTHMPLPLAVPEQQLAGLSVDTPLMVQQEQSGRRVWPLSQRGTHVLLQTSGRFPGHWHRPEDVHA